MENIDVLSETSNQIVEEIQKKSDENIDKVTSINANGPLEITSIIKEAHDLIDKVITESTKHVEEALSYQAIKQKEETVANIEWMTIDEFSIDAGLQKIEEYLETWERGSSWLHCIDFLCRDICQYSTRYRYRVQWSIPTRRKPIPRATASSYFTLDVSDVKPKNEKVKVYFTFESSKLVHRPGESRFREKWFRDIIDAKIVLMEAVTF